MVIIASKEGQLGNRLWHASSFMANAKEHGYSIRHIYFDDLKKYFSESLKNNTGQFPARFGITGMRFMDAIIVSMVSAFVKVCLKIGIRKMLFVEIVSNTNYGQGEEEFDLNDPVFIEKAKKKCVIIVGWLFRDYTHFKKFSNHLKKFWTPDENYLMQIKGVIAEARRRSDVVVGIHIRRGDYRKFNNGIWYYSLEAYAEIMKRISLLNEFHEKKISFLICSDEKTDESVLKEFNVITGERHFIEDLYGLAKCDYVAGPPSTFSMWASFYGSVPLLIIKEKDQQIRMEDFNIIT